MYSLCYYNALYRHGVSVLAPALDVGWIALGGAIVEGDGAGVLVVRHDVVAMKCEIVAVLLGGSDVRFVVGVLNSAVPDGVTVEHFASDSDSLDSVGLVGQVKVICLGGFADFGFEGRAVATSPVLIQIGKRLALMLDSED